VSTLAEGRQGIRIVANDTVSNVNDTFVINFTIDYTGPNVNITGPATGATLSSIRNFNATVRDSLTDVNTVLFQFSNGTNPFNLTASNTSGIWNVSINTNSIVEGGITITVFANDTVGNINNTKSVSITIDNIAEPGSGGGGTPAGESSDNTPTPVSEKKEWESLEPGEIAALEIKDKEIGITEIEFIVLEKAYDIVLQVAKVNYLPGSVSRFDGYTYKTLDISKEATVKDLFKEATVKFKVEKSWLLKNKITSEEVALYHYADEKWVKLPTKTGKEDNKYVYYSSKTPSFSYFVIGKQIIKEIAIPEKPVETPAKEPTIPTTSESGKEAKTESILQKIIGKFTSSGKKISTAIISSVKDYTTYWLLGFIIILLALVGTHIKDLPIPEFLWKLKPVPQVRVEQPESIPARIAPSSAQKEIPQLNHWGKKNYLDLQEELKRVEALIADTPLPEQKNKPLKLTSFKKTSSPENVAAKTEKVRPPQQVDQEEVEQWIKHMFSSRMTESKIITIVNNSTAIPGTRIKAMIDKARVSSLLEKNYHMTQKEIGELKKFISKEKKNGATKRQIVADLIQE
ncbi:MAG: PGF-pre-PGF domain-containing protein, partial [Nanoarchaeota archaeon]